MTNSWPWVVDGSVGRYRGRDATPWDCVWGFGGLVYGCDKCGRCVSGGMTKVRVRVCLLGSSSGRERTRTVRNGTTMPQPLHCTKNMPHGTRVDQRRPASEQRRPSSHPHVAGAHPKSSLDVGCGGRFRDGTVGV